jgi:hypothetical protein
MALEFTQNEVEKALNDFLTDANKRDVAKKTGMYEQVVYGMFNPENERKSCTFVFLQVQCALDEICPQIGEKHWQKVVEMRQLSRKRNVQPFCLDSQAEVVGNEIGEFVAARFGGKPLDVQHSEASDVIRELTKFVVGLEEQMKKEIEKNEIRLSNGFSMVGK